MTVGFFYEQVQETEEQSVNSYERDASGWTDNNWGFLAIGEPTLAETWMEESYSICFLSHRDL